MGRLIETTKCSHQLILPSDGANPVAKSEMNTETNLMLVVVVMAKHMLRKWKEPRKTMAVVNRSIPLSQPSARQ